MQNITFRYTPHLLQRMFVEKGLELLYKDTIDSYRLRLHNPKTIIEELITVCSESQAGMLTDNIYPKETAEEARLILKRGNDALNFNKIARDYYLGLLSNSKKDNYSKLIHASRILLDDNKNYQNELFSSIKETIDNYTGAIKLSTEDKKHFILMLHYLCIELVNQGFTKQYLYSFFRAIFIFIGPSTLTFTDRYEIWKSLGTKNEENFKVIYELIDPSFQFSYFKKIDSHSYAYVSKRYRHSLPSSTPSKIQEFILDKIQEQRTNLIAVKVKSLDHYKAVEESRAKLANDLDLYHLGFNNEIMEIGPKAAVIGSIDPSKSSLLPSNYQIDGYIGSSKEIFETLLKKFRKIKANRVSEETIDKLVSAIRYLRLGSESPELETKLLNYWIGLEYIFTSFNNDEKTIDRIRNFFPLCHSVIYPKRNLHAFHKTLARLDVSKHIPTYNKSLNYLKRRNTYLNQILPNTDSELLKFRTEFYLKWIDNPERITAAVEKHKQNLIWNITRLYRIRNSIVHNAAVTNSIYANVSHIKYYLTFILNSVLEYLSTTPRDVNNDDKITIEDYFITQEVIAGSLKNKPIDKYLSITNPMEILH